MCVCEWAGGRGVSNKTISGEKTSMEKSSNSMSFGRQKNMVL